MKKEINFRLFKVTNKSMKDKESLLLPKLAQSLGEGKKFVHSRIKNLKENESSDKDLLGYYAKTNDYIYGVMMRIANAKDVPELPVNFEKGENIDIQKILDEAEKKGDGKLVCKSMYHFFIYADYVVTDLPMSRPITCFQEYINWLLLLEESDLQFSINPVIESGKIQMIRLKSVVFKDAFEPMPQEKKSNIRRVIDKVLNSLVEGEDLNMKKLHENKIVSASVTVNFEKPRKMAVADYEKAMSAILKTADKPQNIVFVMNNKKQLFGSQVLYSRIETLENEIVLNDTDYIQAMKNVIKGYVAESAK